MTGVVLVHGIRTSATMWRGMSRLLTTAGVEHVAVDLPGHGSRAGEPFSLAAATAVLDEAVAATAGPAVVVGMSLGSYLAAAWAARTAVPPAALVLASCGTRPRGLGLSAYIAAARLIGSLPDAGVGLHTRLARLALGDGAADLLAGGVPVVAMVPTLRAVAAIDLEADLRSLRCPVWFVNGAWDHFRAEERRLLRAVAAGTLVVVPRAGHLVALDRPDVVARLILDVVEQVEDRRPR